MADARQLKQTEVTDADVLNFALNLEVTNGSNPDTPLCHPVLFLAFRNCTNKIRVWKLWELHADNPTCCVQCLEGQFYHCAVYGTPLPEELTGGGPAPIGCQAVNFTDDVTMGLAQNVANDEMLHVQFLRTALGNYSVQCPQVDIGPAFAAAANAALGMNLMPPFSPYTNDLFFLHGAFIFEDLGVTAYKGAAPLLQDPTILTAAAGKPLLGTYALCTWLETDEASKQ